MILMIESDGVALYLYQYKACDLPHFLPMGKVAPLYRNIVEYGW